MAEPINPGMGPNPGGPLRRPAQAISDHSSDLSRFAQRLAAIERLLQGFGSDNIQFENGDGKTERATVLRKGGGARNLATNTSGTTIEPKLRFNRTGTEFIGFFPAKFYEHSLLAAGKEHPIATPTGYLSDTGPSPEFAIVEGTKFHLQFKVSKGGGVVPDSVKFIATAPEKQKVMEPARPGETEQGGVDGLHTQLVGEIVSSDGELIWKPVNTSCVLSIFCPAIESVGGGTKLYFKYKAETGTDQWCSIDGKKNSYGGLAEDGFETREVPVKITVGVDENGKIEVDGLCQILIPNGKEGKYSWKNCNDTDNEPNVTLNFKRGIAVGQASGVDPEEGDSKAGDFEACGCDECSSTQVDGP